MSDGSWCEDLRCIQKPLATIGAEDLVKLERVVKYGFLRKERKNLGKIGSMLKWTQVYVVVTQGCVYIYDNETSKKAKSLFSLSGYCRVSRWTPPCDQLRHGFEIVPEEHSIGERKPYQFIAMNADDVLGWVRHIHGSIKLANGHSLREEWFKTQFDYAEIEKPVSFTKTYREKLEIPDDSHYDTIDDIQTSDRYKPFPTKKKKPPPPVPTYGDTYDDTAFEGERTKAEGAVGVSRAESFYENVLDKKPKKFYANDPTIDSDSDSVHSYENAEDEIKQNYMFPSTDTEKARECLLDKPLQTFLIRDATTPGKKTLQVKLKSGIMKYQIDIQNGKFCFAKVKDNQFDSLSEFVEFYRKNPFPDGKAQLGEGYKFFEHS